MTAVTIHSDFGAQVARLHEFDVDSEILTVAGTMWWLKMAKNKVVWSTKNLGLAKVSLVKK